MLRVGSAAQTRTAGMYQGHHSSAAPAGSNLAETGPLPKGTERGAERGGTRLIFPGIGPESVEIAKNDTATIGQIGPNVADSGPELAVVGPRSGTIVDQHRVDDSAKCVPVTMRPKSPPIPWLRERVDAFCVVPRTLCELAGHNRCEMRKYFFSRALKAHLLFGRSLRRDCTLS